MVDEHGAPQDGFLRANEIYNLSLPAELVVLSACQTGLGREVRGEGLVGLTRGFMYAGAARVVVSLWSVSDRATSELMARFYEKMLRGGQRPAAALRAAQVEMWRQKSWQAPTTGRRSHSKASGNRRERPAEPRPNQSGLRERMVSTFPTRVESLFPRCAS